MLKQANPSWGCQRISDMRARGPALPASASTVARVLHEAGYALEEIATHPHPDHVRHFERAQANQRWQTDRFTFVLKRPNRRVYLVAFLDDHSRFITGYGLHASQSAALVLEVLRAARTSFGTPQEILTDNGSQYVTWRGKSAFTKELEKRGIQQIVAAPRRPQTLGKIERFWGTLWRECLESAVFLDRGDARQRLGLFIDHYNFQRTHAGIDGLVPADRYFGAAAEVKQALAARVAANALTLARHGVPKPPWYLTGQVGGQPVSIHAEGERVIVTGPAGTRQEVALAAPARREELPTPVCPVGVVRGLIDPEVEQEPAPRTSPLDEALAPTPSSLGPVPAEPTAAAGGGRCARWHRLPRRCARPCLRVRRPRPRRSRRGGGRRRAGWGSARMPARRPSGWRRRSSKSWPACARRARPPRPWGSRGRATFRWRAAPCRPWWPVARRGRAARAVTSSGS
jgi:transposase InsO family protein